MSAFLYQATGLSSASFSLLVPAPPNCPVQSEGMWQKQICCLSNCARHKSISLLSSRENTYGENYSRYFTVVSSAPLQHQVLNLNLVTEGDNEHVIVKYKKKGESKRGDVGSLNVLILPSFNGNESRRLDSSGKAITGK